MNATVATTGSASKIAPTIPVGDRHAATLAPRQADRSDMQAPPPSPTRTRSRAFPSTIYDMPFDAFVDYLRTVYGDDDVEMMVSGLKLMDKSGCRPAWTWPEPAPCTTSKSTANGKHSFKDDLDEEDFADTTERPDLED